MEPFSALLALCAGNSAVPVNSPHNGQWRGVLMLSLICVWINDWVNNGEAGDLRRHLGHYDVNVMHLTIPLVVQGLIKISKSAYSNWTSSAIKWKCLACNMIYENLSALQTIPINVQNTTYCLHVTSRVWITYPWRTEAGSQLIFLLQCNANKFWTRFNVNNFSWSFDRTKTNVMVWNISICLI